MQRMRVTPFFRPAVLRGPVRYLSRQSINFLLVDKVVLDPGEAFWGHTEMF